MRRSTTSGVTEVARALDRRRLGAVLGAELVCAAFLVGGPQTVPAGPAVAAPASTSVAPSAPSSVTLPDGRTAQLIDLGAPGGGVLLDRIATELPGAAAAVTAFWGPQWPRDVLVAVAGTPRSVRDPGGRWHRCRCHDHRRADHVRAGRSRDERCRRCESVLRHELFHYAARADTAADAPTWLTEGVADFVGRPACPAHAGAESSRQLPTDAELGRRGPRAARRPTTGPGGSAASSPTRYGVDGLRALYLRGVRARAISTSRPRSGMHSGPTRACWSQWRSLVDARQLIGSR